MAIAKLDASGWTVTDADETHNHPLPSNIRGYSTVRKLDTNEKSSVRSLAEAGSSTLSILSYLKDNFAN
ncbi:hypothetical protein HDU80_002178, partial [Chytriomyces hyalinus]